MRCLQRLEARAGRRLGVHVFRAAPLLSPGPGIAQAPAFTIAEKEALALLRGTGEEPWEHLPLFYQPLSRPFSFSPTLSPLSGAATPQVLEPLGLSFAM